MGHDILMTGFCENCKVTFGFHKYHLEGPNVPWDVMQCFCFHSQVRSLKTAPKMEAARYSVTSASLYQRTWRHIPQNSTIQEKKKYLAKLKNRTKNILIQCSDDILKIPAPKV